MKIKVIVGGIAALLAVSSTDRAYAADYLITPTFGSAPAVIGAGVMAHSVDGGAAVVFALKQGRLWVLARNASSEWQLTFADLWFPPNNVPGQQPFDGSPTAAFMTATPSAGSIIMLCGHGTTSPGFMFCGTGKVESDGSVEHHVLFTPQGPMTQVSNKGFSAGSSPTLVRVQTISGPWKIELFARGPDNQIYYSWRWETGGAWSSWLALPVMSGGVGDPGVTTFANDGRVIACARSAATLEYVCANEVFVNGGNLGWSGWSSVTGASQYGGPPALTRSDSSIYLFSAGGPFLPERVTFVPAGGGAWSSLVSVGGANGFISRPAAFAMYSGALAGPNVLTMALGSNSTILWDTGTSSGWDSGWTPIVAHYRYPTQ